MNNEQRKMSTNTKEKVANHKRGILYWTLQYLVQRKIVKSTNEEMEERK